MIRKYRQTATVDAAQYTNENTAALRRLMGDLYRMPIEAMSERAPGDYEIVSRLPVTSIEPMANGGQHKFVVFAAEGDYVVRDARGVLQCYKQDVFERAFEMVSSHEEIKLKSAPIGRPSKQERRDGTYEERRTAHFARYA